MTRRIALIESNTGYVWGDTIDGWCSDANAPLAVILEQLDKYIGDVDTTLYRYADNDRGFGRPPAYYVAYEIPADLESSGDGQDPKYIEAVTAGRLLGYVWQERADG